MDLTYVLEKQAIYILNELDVERSF